MKTIGPTNIVVSWCSFNPCFSGRGVKTLGCLFYPIPANSIMFQSLFFWKRRENLLDDCYIEEIFTEFQSLFFWKRRENPPSVQAAMLRLIQFQSLFFWKRRENTVRTKTGRWNLVKFQSLFFWKRRENFFLSKLELPNTVSILVFLEEA